MRVQSNSIMPSSFENQSQVIRMTHPHARMSSEVIQKYFNNGLEIVENQVHCPLKRSSGVFKAERHFSIRKCSSRTNKCCLMLVLGLNLNLIISGKAVHKGEHLTTRTLIQNMIYKWCGEFILRIGMI